MFRKAGTIILLMLLEANLAPYAFAAASAAMDENLPFVCKQISESTWNVQSPEFDLHNL